MADRSMFQRSSPLRTPIRLSKLKQHNLKKANDVPPLARQLLRSLNNDRRSSTSSLVTIGQTVRREPCLLDQSCMDQFDDSFTLHMDGTQPLTPRKSPHLLRRGSLTKLSKRRKFGTSITYPAASCSGQGSSSALSGVVTSRKKIGGMRKRMMSSVRKMFGTRGNRTGYNKL